MPVCSKCLKTKSIDEMRKKLGRALGTCKTCHNATERARYKRRRREPGTVKLTPKQKQKQRRIKELLDSLSNELQSSKEIQQTMIEKGHDFGICWTQDTLGELYRDSKISVKQITDHEFLYGLRPPQSYALKLMTRI